MSWTFTTSGSATAKAGANANSSIILSGNVLAKWSDEAEGRIVSESRKNYLSSYSSLPSDVQTLLSDVTSSLIAKQIISYDMSGYTSLAEAQTMIDVQHDNANAGIKILSDFKSGDIRDI